MAQRLRLLTVLTLTVFVDMAPLLMLQVVLAFVDDGVSWSTAADAAVFLPAVALLSLVLAACQTVALIRRARGTGIPVTAEALNATQTHTLQEVPFPRIRAELGDGKRGFAVVRADGGNRVLLRWRPYRTRMSVQVSVTFDELSGEARMKVYAGDGPQWTPLQHRGAAFVALCQIVRSVTPADATTAPVPGR
jgi:predicted small secreted protein